MVFLGMFNIQCHEIKGYVYVSQGMCHDHPFIYLSFKVIKYHRLLIMRNGGVVNEC